MSGYKGGSKGFFSMLKKRGGGPTVIENFSFENIWTSRKLNKCMNKLYSLFNHGLGWGLWLDSLLVNLIDENPFYIVGEIQSLML